MDQQELDCRTRVSQRSMTSKLTGQDQRVAGEGARQSLFDPSPLPSRGKHRANCLDGGDPIWASSRYDRTPRPVGANQIPASNNYRPAASVDAHKEKQRQSQADVDPAPISADL